MSLRQPQNIVPAGTAPTFTAVAASDTMAVDSDRLTAEFRSTHSATISVSVTSYEVLENGDTAPAKVYTIPIGSVTPAEIRIPLYKSYLNPATNLATITCTPTTTVTMAVVRR